MMMIPTPLYVHFWRRTTNENPKCTNRTMSDGSLSAESNIIEWISDSDIGTCIGCNNKGLLGNICSECEGTGFVFDSFKFGTLTDDIESKTLTSENSEEESVANSVSHEINNASLCLIDNLVLEENINSEENGISSKSIEDLKLEQSDSYFDCFDEYFDTLEFDTTIVFDDTKPNNFNEYFDALDGFDIKESNEHCHHDHYSVETSLNWFSEFIFKYVSAFIFSFPGYFVCYYLTMF